MSILNNFVWLLAFLPLLSAQLNEEDDAYRVADQPANFGLVEVNLICHRFQLFFVVSY